MKFLIIQTAFIGDVILATALVEKLRRQFPEAEIDFLLRKGNEKLLTGHPNIRKLLVWEKRRKYRSLFQILSSIRKERYDLVVNCQRFASSGFLTVFSGAAKTVGFDKNPLSLFFSKKMPHRIGNGQHEVARKLSLMSDIAGDAFEMPRLYHAEADFEKVEALKKRLRYVCIAPTSVWFTKQWPAHKWLAFMRLIPEQTQIFLLGGPGDHEVCEQLAKALEKENVHNLAGQLSFLESAALMQGAIMNYVNDSGPMHIASAMNAPVTAVFCSTVPSFGFGPLSDRSLIVETTEPLSCRPCGLHGYKACPLGHFACAESIPEDALEFPETA